MYDDIKLQVLVMEKLEIAIVSLALEILVLFCRLTSEMLMECAAIQHLTSLALRPSY